MNQFSIRDIENLTGVKAHTLRAWEKRYGIVIPPTPPGKHRIYNSEDLRQILKITSLYHSGIKISKIAEMSSEEINSCTYDTDRKTNFDVFITELIDYTFGMEEGPFKRLISQLTETMGLENMFTHILFPVLNRIGSLWMTGHLIPLQEHFASNIIRNELIKSIDGLNQKNWNGNESILLFTPSNEQHEIPLLFINYILRKHQIKTVYLGADASLESIAECMSIKHVKVMVFYLVTNLLEKDAVSYINQLSDSYPNKKLLCGGPALKKLKTKNSNVKIALDLGNLIESAKNAMYLD